MLSIGNELVFRSTIQPSPSPTTFVYTNQHHTTCGSQAINFPGICTLAETFDKAVAAFQARCESVPQSSLAVNPTHLLLDSTRISPWDIMRRVRMSLDCTFAKEVSTKQQERDSDICCTIEVSNPQHPSDGTFTVCEAHILHVIDSCSTRGTGYWALDLQRSSTGTRSGVEPYLVVQLLRLLAQKFHYALWTQSGQVSPLVSDPHVFQTPTPLPKSLSVTEKQTALESIQKLCDDLNKDSKSHCTLSLLVLCTLSSMCCDQGRALIQQFCRQSQHRRRQYTYEEGRLITQLRSNVGCQVDKDDAGAGLNLPSY